MIAAFVQKLDHAQRAKSHGSTQDRCATVSRCQRTELSLTKKIDDPTVLRLFGLIALSLKPRSNSSAAFLRSLPSVFARYSCSLPGANVTPDLARQS